jgi:diadenosine tetraphosphate (Ap4A) HIT family hydrolase
MEHTPCSAINVSSVLRTQAPGTLNLCCSPLASGSPPESSSAKYGRGRCSIARHRCHLGLLDMGQVVRSIACPFCVPDRVLLVQSPIAMAFEDAFPASKGHALIVPRVHRETYFECTAEERAGMWSLVDQVRDLAVARYMPDGFNVGFNVGAAAGQTVFHAHIHVIPRFIGDVPDPRGGVRHAVVGRGLPNP